MEENKIEIRAPFYRGLLLVFINAIFYISLGSFILIVIMFITKKFELAGLIVALYLLMLISFIAIKVYEKSSKSKIVIDEYEIAKYRNNEKVKSIRIEDIEKIYFAKYSFPGGPFDEFNVYSIEKDRIHFYALSSNIPKIERITKKILK